MGSASLFSLFPGSDFKPWGDFCRILHLCHSSSSICLGCNYLRENNQNCSFHDWINQLLKGASVPMEYLMVLNVHRSYGQKLHKDKISPGLFNTAFPMPVPWHKYWVNKCISKGRAGRFTRKPIHHSSICLTLPWLCVFALVIPPMPFRNGLAS